jgi:hypothetical protein
VDFDKDGDLDLLVGEKYESVHYYQRQSDGSLKEQPLLIKLEKPPESTPELTLAYMSISADIVDWAGSGKFDVVLGSDVYKSGRSFAVRLYRNKGTASAPVFNTYDTLKDKSGNAILVDCARVEVADINMDGKKDLLVGNRIVTIRYYRNVGTNTSPVFEADKLVPNALYGIPDAPNFEQAAGFGYGTPRVYDWNKDGKPDLLLSGYPTGTIMIYLNDAATPAQTVEHKAFGSVQVVVTQRSSSHLDITYSAIRASGIRLSLVDAQGNKIASLVGSHQALGTYTVELNSAGLGRGVYLVQLQTNETGIVKKIVIAH